MRSFLILLLSALALSAQSPISVGLKAGYVRNSRQTSEIVPFKGGPYVELKLPVLPTFETGLMIERYSAGPTSATIYQVPILVKKRFNAVAVKPFFSAGVTLRRIPSLDDMHPGLTLAGGVTLGLLPIKIEPEIRFTRWVQSSFTPRSQQVEFLVGIRF